jgi:hypothetical protein
VLALACFTFLISLVPLAFLFFAVPPRWAASIWLSTAGMEVLAGLSSAHLLFVARQGDRARAQALCGWVGGVALGLALLGVIAMVSGTLVGSFLASLGPWCGACGT